MKTSGFFRMIDIFHPGFSRGLKSVASVFLMSGLALCSNINSLKEDFDILIRNGTILDGTANPRKSGDVGITGDSITAIGDLSGKTAKIVLEAGGRVVGPGFIDVHTHCDRGFGKPETAANLNYVSQGVTTVVTGNCGSGSFRITEMKRTWEKIGLGTNALMLTGYGTIRNAVMGVATRPPTAEESGKMNALLREALTQGAWGLSTGLPYIPDRYATPEELIAMAKIVAGFGGVFSSHIRDEGSHLLEAIDESIRVGRESGARVHISHLKASGKANWGMMKEAARLIDSARRDGIALTADMYPYHGAAIVPFLMSFNVPRDLEPFPELLEMADFYFILNRLGVSVEDIKKRGGKAPWPKAEWLKRYGAELAAAFADEAKKEKIKKLTLDGALDRLNWVPIFGWDNFLITNAGRNPSLRGKILSDIAQERKSDPFDVAVDLFLQEKEDLTVSVCVMSEDDIRYGLRQDWLMIASDGSSVRYKAGNVHPRYYGSAARVLGKYSREEGVLTLEQAVKKMTSLPAQLFHLKDRGLLKKGYKADIVVFDPDTVRDHATYQDPHQLSTGIEYVLINGQVSVEQGKYNNSLNGRVLLSWQHPENRGN
jgi:N-acyl-D-aspartate/D-glutamate deacylase